MASSRIIVPVILLGLAAGIAALIISQPDPGTANDPDAAPDTAGETQTNGPAPEPEVGVEMESEIVNPEELSAGYPHEDLDALLWVRTSAEYDAIARQTFRAARASVGDALMQSDWTACLEQQAMVESGDKGSDWLASLPPAVVMDVDETVLNNSGFQVGLIEDDEEYSPDRWKEFCREESSTAIPGSVDFVNACRAAGVTVLFVTNREYEVEAETRSNLIATGLMKEDDADIVFTKYEQEEWSSDKSTRRAHIADQYRILLLLGDDLNDFVTLETRPSHEERRAAVEQYRDRIGEQWFVLPNPNYGGWEQTLYNYDYNATKETKRERKREQMTVSSEPASLQESEANETTEAEASTEARENTGAELDAGTGDTPDGT